MALVKETILPNDLSPWVEMGRAQHWMQLSSHDPSAMMR